MSRTPGLYGLVALSILGLVANVFTTSGPTSDSVALRGHQQTLHLYGADGSIPAIVSSGDGGWIHLGPHIAELLASHGYFVVGFDVKAYLESFTSGKTTLRAEDEPA